jgi:nitrite reductase/ring-hydroxylating ferredoxin subunit
MVSPRHLCRLAELPDGRARGFDLGGQGPGRIFVVHRAGAVRAWVDRCPHHGTPLPWRRDAYLNAAGDRIVCAAHGALFELEGGVCVQGPCLGDRLQPVACAVTAGGDVVLVEGEARGPEERTATATPPCAH